MALKRSDEITGTNKLDATFSLNRATIHQIVFSRSRCSSLQAAGRNNSALISIARPPFAGFQGAGWGLPGEAGANAIRKGAIKCAYVWFIVTPWPMSNRSG